MRASTGLALLLALPCGARGKVTPLPWDEAEAKAKALLDQMEPAEKYSLMRGIGWTASTSPAEPGVPGGYTRCPMGSFTCGADNFECAPGCTCIYDACYKPAQNQSLLKGQLDKWWYVGNTAPNFRLGIPSLNLQDAAGGFRTYWTELVGTVTCWPSLLSMAATWDVKMVETLAVALGEEHNGKGANGILGPSINVHRVARGGRNFEYLSGEDPYLGAQLTGAYVRGVQSQGVLAVMKHFVLNNQETNRNTESSNVDDQTLWELYYPPFQAAVDAGASAAMCSYNLEDGTYSCSNSKQLQNLKRRMGFKGFVQSDWWATHATSVEAGLDQEMPGTETFFSPANLAALNQTAVDASVLRILSVMYRLDLFNSTKTSSPSEEWFMKNVTGAAHRSLALASATESIVLLRNIGGVLPLTYLDGTARVQTIAVVGSPAVAQPYDPAAPGAAWQQGDYYSGGGSGHVTASTLALVTPLQGITAKAALLGIQVVAAPSDDHTAAAAAARSADVTIVVAATTSGESLDRASLSLDNDADGLISAVASAARPTVVLVQAPGAVTMPWRDDVGAILTMFLGGQETGSAWAAVLFGDHAPTGRLPIMLPATEQDTILPGTSAVVPYLEGLRTSYRNSDFTAAFPFGHGLTYTTFEFGPMISAACGDALCISAPILNTGNVAAKSVAQLYMEFPPVALQPAATLKGFAKTAVLRPGGAETVTFTLTDRDLSYFDTTATSYADGTATPGAWKKVASAVAHLGASSADLRQSLPLILQGAPEVLV